MSDHYFLSYARADQDFALRLARDLKAVGVLLWVDQVDIRPSDRWDRAVEAAVRECLGLVLVLSPRSAASDNVLDEVTVALDAGKPVIPVLMEPCRAPLRLARNQFIDAAADYEGAVARCRQAVTAPTRTLADPGSIRQSSPPRESTRLPPEIAARLSTLLTAYMGPIASHLVEEEIRVGGALTEVSRRLAARIPRDADRALFLAAAAAL